MAECQWELNYRAFRKLACIYQADDGGIPDLLLEDGVFRKSLFAQNSGQKIKSAVDRVLACNSMPALDWDDGLEIKVCKFPDELASNDHLITPECFYLQWPINTSNSKSDKLVTLFKEENITPSELSADFYKPDLHVRFQKWAHMLTKAHDSDFRDHTRYQDDDALLRQHFDENDVDDLPGDKLKLRVMEGNEHSKLVYPSEAPDKTWEMHMAAEGQPCPEGEMGAAVTAKCTLTCPNFWEDHHVNEPADVVNDCKE